MCVRICWLRAIQFVGVFACATALFAACFFFAEKKRIIRVVVYSPHGKQILADLERRFEALHRDDEVRIVIDPHYIRSQTLLERLMNERTKPRCDVWWGGPSTMFMQAKEKGLLEPYRTAEVADHLRDEHRDANYFWFGAFLSPHVIIYNHRKLSKEEAPKDWDDLLDPKWKGKIILRDPVSSGTMRTIFSAMMYRFVSQTGSPEKGYDWLRRLHANTRAYADTMESLFTELHAGETATVSMWELSDIILQRDWYGYDFEYIIPASGTPIVIEGVAILRGAPHPETAKKFFDFVTSRENQLYLAYPENEYFRIPTRKDLHGELPEWIGGIDTGADEFDKISMSVDWDVIRRHEAEWMAYWDQHIKTGE